MGSGETSGESRVNLVMPLEWRTRRLTFCGGALVAMLIAVPALAQPSFDYDRLVDAYATGHLNEAVSQLSRWPSEQVKGAVVCSSRPLRRKRH